MLYHHTIGFSRKILLVIISLILSIGLLISFSMILAQYEISYGLILKVAWAQNNNSSLIVSSIEDIFENATAALESNNIDHTKVFLDLISKRLTTLSDNNTQSFANTKLLLTDATNSLQNNNTNDTSLYLDLAESNFRMESKSSDFNGIAGFDMPREKLGFKIYENPFREIEILYPQNWTLIEYPYNPASNNTIAGFFSSEQTSSQMGNISGVSGNFVPYLDLFEFDSKNKSLDVIANQILDQFRNTTNFAIGSSESISLKDNRTAHKIVYDVIIGREEHLKKVQVYTLINDKVYTLSFTAQRDLFDDYLPTVDEMIMSFGTLKGVTK